MKVYSGKNRGGMEVERLRERLIRELREGGSQEGKRQKKSGGNRKHRKGKQKLCEHKIKVSTAFVLSMLHTSKGQAANYCASRTNKEKKLVKQIFQLPFKSPFQSFVKGWIPNVVKEYR